ncbi:flagellar biosynthetic protein FliQ [Acidocella aromatica]|uniref:Flagellar biosynthetic protein FliQ n=1 Tax=Acidocella aromatica TaxID=1303579 RepID=A0A840VFQ5_9PROT|nr:flagellar biosynthetic protein FliQ [Acidocella aromatica]MBB5373727.1 flagellar biosynthetic protein FliQ [Acidocella aromatica]
MPLYIKLLHEAMGTAFNATAPLILILVLVGLITSLLQGALQIEDATFALLPKTFALIILALTGGFGALNIFETMATLFITHAPTLVRQSWY